MNDETPVLRDTPTQGESPQPDAGREAVPKKKRGKVSAKAAAAAIEASALEPRQSASEHSNELRLLCCT